jgi:hypothetical protein
MEIHGTYQRRGFRRALLLMEHALALGLGLILLGLAVAPCMAGGGPSTAFTYQGQLKDGANPANGSYDFRFILYDSDVGGSQVGQILFLDDKLVAGGLVTLELDFGAGVFDGRLLYLEVAVRPGSVDNANRDDGTYTKLAPRQKQTATPYAIYAQTIADGAVNTNKLAAGAVSPDKLSLPFEVNGASALPLLGAVNSQAGGIGVKGFNSTSNMIGYLGTGGEGVYGKSMNDNGIGVHGVANQGSGAKGILGESSAGAGVSGASASGTGLMGTSNDGFGVSGASATNSGVSGVRGTDPVRTVTGGVYGGCDQNGPGVHGVTSGAGQSGVFGVGKDNATWGTNGVSGQTFSSKDDVSGVFGVTQDATHRNYGVRGWSGSASAGSAGVYGASQAAAAYGVYGKSDQWKSSGWCGGGVTSDPLLYYDASVGLYGTGVSNFDNGNSIYGVGVYGKGSAYGVVGSASTDGVYGHAEGGTWSTGVRGESYDQYGYGVYGLQGDGSIGNSNYGILGDPQCGIYAVVSKSYAVPANTAALMASQSMPGADGNIIIGMHYSTNKFRVDSTGKVFANGGFQDSGADLAEFILTSDAPQPGDVVEIDPDHPGQFRRCAAANSTAVAGVISTQPGVSLGADKPAEKTATGPQLALAGRVPVKVCVEGGPIRPGDLLVASSAPGRAMRAPANPPPGTIIGKALGKLGAGEGLIEMLAMLR